MTDFKAYLKNCYNGFCGYMRTDSKGEEITIYTISGLMLAFACRRIRPITKFGSASDIPKHFIRNKVRQYGVIRGIDPSLKNGPVLLIDHKPPLHYLVPSNKLLPVCITGIMVYANGYSWLQTVAVGKKVEFVTISRKSGDSAECQVFIICPENKEKQAVDITEALLGLGFGKLSPPEMNVLKDTTWKKYYQYLLSVEDRAKNERIGLWSESLPPKPWITRKSKQLVNYLVQSISPVHTRLPYIVR